MVAHGVPALIRYLGGEITREQAAEIAAPTPAITPSGNSPGSGINCLSSNG